MAGLHWRCFNIVNLITATVTDVVNGVVGLGGLVVQALCLSRYSHYLPTQPPAQLLTQVVLASHKPGCGSKFKILTDGVSRLKLSQSVL